MTRPFPNEEAADEQRLEASARRYPQRVPRADLAAVERLKQRADLEDLPRTIVVVGTNGKTSTATYIERVLLATGLRVGATTSPHLRAWSERVRVLGQRVGARWLADEVQRLDRLAVDDREQLRFFDLLTLATLRIFTQDDVDVAVFEAGIGGRLDTTAVLHPKIVVLTGIALDHVELLGTDERSILSEKLGIAEADALVVAAPLGGDLEAAAAVEAARRGATLRIVETGGGSFVQQNQALAMSAAEAALALFGLSVDRDRTVESSALAEPVPGRLERGRFDDVRYLLDAAHNEEGWSALMSEVAEPIVAVVSVSADRPLERFASIVHRPQVLAAVATTAWEGRSAPAAALGHALADAGLDVETVVGPKEAVRRGIELARGRAATLAVFGTSYLLGHALEVLRPPARSS